MTTQVRPPSADARRTPLFALVAAYFISTAGTAMSALAIPWLVLTTTGSASRTGLVVFAEMAPYVTLQAISGPWVDRLGAHRTCGWGNGIAAAAVGAIPALHAAGLLHLSVLLALVAIAGAVRGMSDCANTALLPGAASLAAMPLERVTGVNSGANQAGLLLGAPLAGVLIAVTGPATVVLVDAATFAVAALLISSLVPASVQPDTGATDEATPLHYFGQLAEGVRFVRRDRLILTLIGMIGITNLLDYALVAVMLPVWVRERLGEAAALGVIVGAGGIGALIGNGIGAWLSPRLPRRRTFAIGYLIAGAPMFVVLAFTSVLWPPLVMSFIAGLGAGAVNPILVAVTYERIPEALITRVMGVVKASAWVGIPFGSLLGGILTQAAGVRVALLVAAGVFLFATLPPFVLRVFAEMNRAEPVTEP